MNYDNELKVEFVSKSSNEGLARVIATSFVSQLDPTLEELADVRTAVSEAVTNAIIHGYENKTGMIKMECKLLSDSVIISISDKGKGIEDIDLAMQPLYTSKPELERSGMGFTVMQSFMDEVVVESNKDSGTCVTMKKKFMSLGQYDDLDIKTVENEKD